MDLLREVQLQAMVVCGRMAYSLPRPVLSLASSQASIYRRVNRDYSETGTIVESNQGLSVQSMRALVTSSTKEKWKGELNVIRVFSELC